MSHVPPFRNPTHWETSATLPPPMKGMCGCWYWERTPDPFHPAAFEGTELGPRMAATPEAREPRRMGWMAIDYCENAVGWVPDGTRFGNAQEPYTIQEGPHGHLCAYPENSQEMLTRHADMIARRKPPFED